MTRTFNILGILCYAVTLYSQDTDKKTEHRISFKSQYIQIKDEFNYGLVNRGLNGDYQISADEAMPIVDEIIDACYRYKIS